jgi:hypothetical protein
VSWTHPLPHASYLDRCEELLFLVGQFVDHRKHVFLSICRVLSMSSSNQILKDSNIEFVTCLERYSSSFRLPKSSGLLLQRPERRSRAGMGWIEGSIEFQYLDCLWTMHWQDTQTDHSL